LDYILFAPPKHDRTALIDADNVDRALADIDADHRD